MAAAVASVAAAAKQTFRPFLGSISKRVELARKRKLLYIDCHSEAQVFLCKNELIYPEKITGIFSSSTQSVKNICAGKNAQAVTFVWPQEFLERKWNLILTSIFIHKQSVWAKLQEWHLKWKIFWMKITLIWKWKKKPNLGIFQKLGLWRALLFSY